MGIRKGEQKCITNLSVLYIQESGIAIWSIQRASGGERPQTIFYFLISKCSLVFYYRTSARWTRVGIGIDLFQQIRRQ